MLTKFRRKIFEIIFLIKPFLLYDKNVKTKVYISWERKELLRWNKKAFFITFKVLSLKQKNKFFSKMNARLQKNKKNQELPTCGKLFAEVVIFVSVNTFFQLTLVCTTDSHTGFCSVLLLREHELNFFFHLDFPFLITYTSSSNWHVLISV